ncbi:MAG: hypothetical protein KDA91_25555, partial [Planctomycetaceae bacterium]|nr:hypothetical protein [Planctomycetaceae bacterium]
KSGQQQGGGSGGAPGSSSGGNQSSGDQAGGGGAAGTASGPLNPSPNDQPREGEMRGGRTGEGVAGKNRGNGADGDGTSGSSNSQTERIEEVAKAADLVLKRLQQDLDRGEVDQELLEKLGWTEEDLKAFTDRMGQQLAERNESQTGQEKSLTQKGFEEMLRSMNPGKPAQQRDGQTDRQIDSQDTTLRQTTPPARYREMYRIYQRSISGYETSKAGSNQKNGN